MPTSILPAFCLVTKTHSAPYLPSIVGDGGDSFVRRCWEALNPIIGIVWQPTWMGVAVADRDLAASAAANALVFEDALAPYVQTKVAWATERATSGWLDCTGCIWCVFDDERFVRQELSDAERQDPALPYRLYWSIGDVCMPASATPDWVATRIQTEAIRILREAGFTAVPEARTVDGEPHLGVTFKRRSKLLPFLR